MVVVIVEYPWSPHILVVASAYPGIGRRGGGGTLPNIRALTYHAPGGQPPNSKGTHQLAVHHSAYFARL